MAEKPKLICGLSCSAERTCSVLFHRRPCDEFDSTHNQPKSTQGLQIPKYRQVMDTYSPMAQDLKASHTVTETKKRSAAHAFNLASCSLCELNTPLLCLSSSLSLFSPLHCSVCAGLVDEVFAALCRIRHFPVRENGYFGQILQNQVLVENFFYFLLCSNFGLVWVEKWDKK